MWYTRIIPIICLLWPLMGEAQSDLRDWKYTLAFTVDHSAGIVPLESYQVRILLHTAQLIAEGKLDSTGKDLRITDSDGRSLLCHWVENDLLGSEATIWVRVPYVAPGEIKSLFVYYGNPAATPVDNGDCTFLLFDDFSAPGPDLSKWEKYGDGDLQLKAGKAVFKAEGNDAILRSRQRFEIPIITEMRVTHTLGRYNSLALIQDFAPYWSGYTLSLNDDASRMELAITEPEVTPCGGYSFLPSYKSEAAGPTTGIWSLTWITNNTVFANWPGGALLEQNSLWTFRPMHVALGTLACHFQGDFSGNLEVDWIRVRKFTANEPSIMLGTEKRNTAIGSLYVNEGVRG